MGEMDTVEGAGLVGSFGIINVLNFAHADYLCSQDANVYNIEFVRFKIRDMDSGIDLFEVTKGEDEEEEGPKEPPPRYVKYQFPPEFLKLRSVGAT